MISGPSGTGKGAICDALKAAGTAELSVSMTTRAPRANEIEGESYYFVSRERFREAIGGGELLEYTEVFGEYYGTPQAPVIEQLKAGRDVILEIEVNGAMQVRDSMPDAVLVFVLPPSRRELKRRIEGRGTETDDSIAQRLDRAESEIAQVRHYDYYIVNEELDKAVSDMAGIIRYEALLNMDGPSGPHSSEDLAISIRASELMVGLKADALMKGYLKGNLGKEIERYRKKVSKP